jgi:hypothetical protein
MMDCHPTAFSLRAGRGGKGGEKDKSKGEDAPAATKTDGGAAAKK